MGLQRVRRCRQVDPEWQYSRAATNELRNIRLGKTHKEYALSIDVDPNRMGCILEPVAIIDDGSRLYSSIIRRGMVICQRLSIERDCDRGNHVSVNVVEQCPNNDSIS